jgi:hypothetical protein
VSEQPGQRSALLQRLSEQSDNPIFREVAGKLAEVARDIECALKPAKPTEATARPWKIYYDGEREWIGGVNGGDIVADKPTFGAQEGRWEVNAALIVKAVNEHAALVQVAEAAEIIRSKQVNNLASALPVRLSPDLFAGLSGGRCRWQLERK